MMRIFFLLLLLTAQYKAFSQPEANKTISPKIDVRHLVLHLKFDWHNKQAYGTATLHIALLEPADYVALDAGMLRINTVSLNGKKLQFDYDGGDSDDGLKIALDRRYHTNEQLEITIDYRTHHVNQSDPNALGGSFGKGLRFTQPTRVSPTKRKQIWSIGEAEINRYWFPSNDTPGDYRTTELYATVDQKLSVLSNGNLINIKENNDFTRTFYYKTDIPYPNFLTTIIVGEYVDIRQKSGNTTLHTFAYPDEKAAAEASIERLPDMLNYFEKISGVAFPYASYSQVMVQDYPFPGLIGSPGMSVLSDNFVDDFKTHADYLYLWDGVEADALASQWFGNLISTKNWGDCWLSKSFARYFDGLYTGYKNGHDEYLMWYHPYDSFLTFGDWNNGNRHPIATSNYDNTENFVGDNHNRYRGSLVLRMLQKELGNKVWFKAIKQYVKTNAHKTVTTADLQKAVETVSGRKMDWFFEQWIYKTGHPQFEISKSYDAGKKLLILELKQTQKLDEASNYPQVAFFRGKMEIEIEGKIHTVQLGAKAVNRFTFKLRHNPKLINPDFENTWIREFKTEKTGTEWLYQLQHSKDVLARNAAINELAKQYKTATENDKPITKKALLTVIQSNCYWRLKVAAINGLVSLYKADFDKPSVQYDAETTKVLLQLIEKGAPWVRVAAVSALGQTNDPQFANVYRKALNDPSERVVGAAAVALGKSKSPEAFDALVRLKDKPSWKNQSLMSSLNGLAALGDPRGVQIALNALKDNRSPRWFLANGWDYPLVAAQTLHALGKTDEAYPLLLERFKTSLEENDTNDIFSTTQLIAIIAHSNSQEVFDLLKEKFKDDANALSAVNQYENQFKTSVKK